jgi:peptide/nickel transport system substrate-binding protein
MNCNSKPLFSLLIVIAAISIVFVGTPVLPTVAQGGGTEADLETSYFLTVQDFEEATGVELTFSEAPMLEEMVAAGELPPVEERLPEEPAVVVPHEEMGVYGGTWKAVESHPRGRNLTQVILTEGFMQFSRDVSTVRPNLLKAIDFEDEGKTMVLTFRKGGRTSSTTTTTRD